jgi:molecular chaperone DnaK (HSP70)
MKLNKEQRAAVIHKVQTIADKRMEKAKKEALENFKPDAGYNELQNLLKQYNKLAASLNNYLKLIGFNFWDKAKEYKVEEILEHYKHTKIRIPKYLVNSRLLETELILMSLVDMSMEEIIEKLLDSSLVE